jgi:hypothetical protein
MAKLFKLSLGKPAEPDDDLDFPDFVFDNPEVEDNRTPTTKVITTGVDSFSNALRDKEKIKKKLLENLPSEYGEAVDLATSGFQDTRNFIDDSIRDIKPVVGSITKSVKAFLPDNLAKRLDKLEEWARVSDYGKGPTLEQQREQSIGIELGRIFQEQADQELAKDQAERAEDDAKDKVKLALDFNKHRKEMEALNAISKAVQGTNLYTTRINAQYQKKSLELQYRTLFANRDILETLRKSQADDKALLSAIAKNTGLPEYVKLRSNERLKQEFKNRFVGKTFDTVKGFGNELIENLKREVSGGIETAKTMADMLAMGSDMSAMMQEYESKKTLGQRASGLGGGLLAGKLQDVLIGRLGQLTRNNPDLAKKIARGSNELGYLLENRDRLLRSTQNIDDDHENVLLRMLGRTTRNFGPKTDVDTFIRRGDSGSYNEPSLFTNRVAKSITDIIPGYLAKMLRELTILRTGDTKTDLVSYDHKRDRFMKQGTQIRLTQRSLRKGTSNTEAQLQSIISDVERRTTLSDEERAHFSEFLINYSATGNAFSIRDFSKAETYSPYIRGPLAEKLASAFRTNYEDMDPGERARRQRELANTFNRIGDSLSDQRAEAQRLVDVGQESIARKAGLINSGGNYAFREQVKDISKRIRSNGPAKYRTQEEIGRLDREQALPSNWDAREKYGKYRDDEGIVSDILLKQDISPAAKEGYLSKLSKLPLSNWTYKDGTAYSDGGKPHVGPMAQNLSNLFGSSVAPKGGTRIDLVNMNGVLTGAVKELNDKVDKVGQGLGIKESTTTDYKTKLTEEIRDYTKKISEANLFSLAMVGSIDLSKLNINNLDLGKIITQTKDQAKKAGKWGYDYIQDNSVKSHLHALVNAGLGGMEGIYRVGDKLGRKALTTVREKATWTWNNPIKQGMNKLRDRKIDLTERFDVFVEGEEVPRMFSSRIRQNNYVEASKPDKFLVTRADIRAVDSDILDAKTGEVVIYKQELSQLVIKHSYTNKLVRLANFTGDQLGKAKQALQGYVPIGFQMTHKAFKLTKRFALNWLDNPTDVYVKGESIPRLFKHKMMSGEYIRASDGKVVERPTMIDGMVYDRQEQLVLSVEDFRKGLTNVHGQPFTKPLRKIFDNINNLNRKVIDSAVKVGRGALDIGKGLLAGTTRLATHGLAGLQGYQIPDVGFNGLGNTESNKLLTNIRDILDARLPGGGGVGYGGLLKDAEGNEIVGPKNLNRLTNNVSKQIPNTVKTYATDGSSLITGGLSLAGKTAKGIWNSIKGRTKTATESVKESKAYKDLESKKDELSKKFKDSKAKTEEKLSKLEDKLTLREKVSNFTNKFKTGKNADGTRLGSWQSMKDRENVNKSNHDKELEAVKTYATKNTFDLIGKAIGGVLGKVKDGILGLLGMAGLFGGKGKGGLLRRGAGLLGRGAGLMGKSFVKGLVGLPGHLARVGGLAVKGVPALLGAGKAIAGGVGAAAASPALPVVAGAAAVAGAAYGGYRLFKYLSTKKWNDLEILRMLEYGFRGGDTEIFKKLYALEQIVAKASSVMDGSLSIDNNKLNTKAIYDIFSLKAEDDSEDNLERIENFNAWYEYRFVPVFSKWSMATDKVYGSISLDKISRKDSVKHLELIEEVSKSNDGWSVPNSPFNNSDLNTNSIIITRYRTSLRDNLKKEEEKQGTSKTKQILGILGKATPAALIKSGLGKFGDTKFGAAVNKGIETAGRLSGVTATKKRIAEFTKSLTSPLKTVVGAAKKAVMKYTLPGMLATAITKRRKAPMSPLESIKYKAYGLIDLEKQKVEALRKLEDLVAKDVSFSDTGLIEYEGDLEKLVESSRLLFGIDVEDEEKNKDLSEWLNGRFIPTFILYYSGIRAVKPVTNFELLKTFEQDLGSEALGIASALIGNESSWSVSASPWTGYTLSTVASSDVNNVLDFIKRSTKDEKYEDFSKTAPANTTAGKAKTSKVAYQPPRTARDYIPPKPATGDDLSVPEAEEAPKATGGGAPVQKTIGTGSVGNLKLAPGELASGTAASKYIKLNKADVNISNMNPDFMKLFNGMVEEYGEKTGKSVMVTSAWRSTAKQRELYNRLPRGRAARPGSSLHEFGLALDVNTADLDAMDKMGLLRKYGFTRPIAKESWHIEPAGFNSASIIQAVKTDSNLARERIMASIGRGGGGLGDTARNSKTYYRDWDNHNRIFNATVAPSKEEAEKIFNETNIAGVGRSTNTGGYGKSIEGLKVNSVATRDNPSTGSRIAGLGSENQELPGGGVPTMASSSGINLKPDIAKVNTERYNLMAEAGKAKAWESLPLSTGSGWSNQGPLIEEAAKLAGLDVGLAAAVAAKESSLRPNAAAAGKARGLYQFMPATFDSMVAKYGGKYGITKTNANVMDPRQNAILGAHYVKDGIKHVNAKSPGWAYLTHFLGQGSHLRTFMNLKDDEIAANKLSGPAKWNPAVFYDNGRPRTKAEIVAWADNELRKQITAFKIPHQIGLAESSKTDNKEPSISREDISFISSITNPTTNPNVVSPTTEETTTRETGRLENINRPSRTQLASINQPAQTGSDPSRVFEGLDTTNNILNKQVDILTEIRDLTNKLVEMGVIANQPEPPEYININAANHQTNKPNEVRQQVKTPQYLSKPMISRERVI